MSSSRPDPVDGLKSLLVLAVIAAVVIAAIGGAAALVLGVGQIQEGERGITTTNGNFQGDVKSPGLYVTNGLIQGMRTVNVREQAYTMSGQQQEGAVERDDSLGVTTSDGVQAQIDVTVNFQTPPGQAGQFYVDWQNHETYIERIIRPAVRDVVRAQASTLSANNLYKEVGRQQLTNATIRELNRQMEGTHVRLESVNIRDVRYEQGYAQALQQEQTNQREAEAKRIQARGNADAQRIEANGDANATRIRAEGQAQANERLDDSLSQAVLEQRRIEALRDANTVYVPRESGGPVLTRNVSTDGQGPTTNTTNTTNTTSLNVSG